MSTKPDKPPLSDSEKERQICSTHRHGQNGQQLFKDDEKPTENSGGELLSELTGRAFDTFKVNDFAAFFANKVNENAGEFLMTIGPDRKPQNGYTESEIAPINENMLLAAAKINCHASQIFSRKLDALNKDKDDSEHLFNKTYLVRQNFIGIEFIEVNFAVLGNVDAGKSTLVGVLTQNRLDDGKGSARHSVLVLPHEKSTGRTSSISVNVLGFTAEGKAVDSNISARKNLNSLHEISLHSSKIVNFIDLAGHEKYLKTTIAGFTGYELNGSIIVVGSNSGAIGTFKEHMSLCLAFKTPFLIVFTKIDTCPKDVLLKNHRIITSLLKSNTCNKIPLKITSMTEVLKAVKLFNSGKVVPVFLVSNVSGERIELLKSFLNLYQSGITKSGASAGGVDEGEGGEDAEKSNSSERPKILAEVFDAYKIQNFKGAVLSISVKEGGIRVGTLLSIGPAYSLHYEPVEVKSVWRMGEPVEELRKRQTGTISIKNARPAKKIDFVVTKENIQRGMHLLDTAFGNTCKPIWSFRARLTILRHPTAIKVGYQAVVHIGFIKTSIGIVEIKKEDPDHLSKDPPLLVTGDVAEVDIHFIHRAQFIQPGTSFLFREQRTKAVGKILSIDPEQRYHTKNNKFRKINK